MDKKKYKVLSLLCLIIFTVCAVWLGIRCFGDIQAEKQLENMRSQYIFGDAAGSSSENASVEAESPAGQETEGERAGEQTDADVTAAGPTLPGLEGYDVPVLDIDLEAMRENENPHIYAWLLVPGTKVDYPVLQHPDLLDYYLEYNMDGSKGRPGCIYTQNINSTDWTDKHTIIYGHNMSNGTMFASLHNYEDPEFFEEYPYMYIYTAERKVLVYRIFAAYEFSDKHLLGCFDISTDSRYEEYLESIRENEGLNNNFDSDCELNAESRIVTLSTCMASYGKSEKRWLVQGVLVAEGDWEH